jgi:hypothetical protein
MTVPPPLMTSFKPGTRMQGHLPPIFHDRAPTHREVQMKYPLAVLLLACAMATSPARAGDSSAGDTPAAGPTAASPLIGSWSVDVTRLPMPPQARPRSVVITFGKTADNRWSTVVDVVDADGSTRHADGSAPLDGTATAVANNFEADKVAIRMPAPNVVVMTLAKGGQPASTRIYSTADDGRTMVETISHFGPQGLPVTRTNHFTRVAAATR